jgi:hypothetical protein
MESAEEWREFRRECVMMQQYGVVSMPLAPPNPLIELRVPPLLLIKACALLQEVLHEEVLARQIATPAKYHRTLEEDINLLANSVGPLEPYRVELHQVRERRNQAAHTRSANHLWQQLHADIEVIESALIALGRAVRTPRLAIYYERKRIADSADLNIAMQFRELLGVVEDGRQVICFEWLHQVPRMTPAPSRSGA